MLSGAAILSAWEAGQGRTPAGRSLAVLRSQGTAAGETEALTASGLDAALLSLRERAFGPLLECRCDCPACSTRLEFSVEIATLRIEPAPRPPEIKLALPGWGLRVRQPRAVDLLAASNAADAEAARAVLLERCVIEALADGAPVEAARLPEEIVGAVAATLAEADPLGDLQIDLRCPACAHEWREPLDIGAFFWSELCAEARRLFAQVDALARAYGWTEAEIVGLSPLRRQQYLELVEA